MVSCSFKLFFYSISKQYDITPFVISISRDSEINRGKQILNVELDFTQKKEWIPLLEPYKSIVEFYKDPDWTLPYFSGWIEKKIPKLNGNIRTFSLRIVDASEYLEGILINEQYEETSTRTILVDLIENYENSKIYNDYHFRVGNIQEGKIITKTFKYDSFIGVLNFLAEINGYVWQVSPAGRYPDVRKYIDLFPPFSNQSDIIYTTEKSKFNIKKGSIEYDDGMTSFFNACYLFGGKTKSSLIVERFRYFSYMGENKAFQTRYEPHFDIGPDFRGINGTYISINGISQTIGIDGKDTDREVYFNSREKFIRLGVVPPDNSDIEISYYWFYPLMVYEENTESIMEFYKKEIVFHRNDITQRSIGREFLKSQLEKFSYPIQKLSFSVENDLKTPEVGQYVLIQIPEFQINKYFSLVKKNETWTLPHWQETDLEFEDVRENIEKRIREIENRLKRLEDKDQEDTILDKYSFYREYLTTRDIIIHEIKIGEEIWWKVGDPVGFGQIF
ncbi:MAG: hypothetical protein NC833_03290 [Candidatus Omnitrophica bacterium]|nr:hypothetical protein [Candidatus Omnitrophota bacterium]